MIMPFIEQSNAFRLFNFNVDLNTAAVNQAAREQNVPTFICPSHPSSSPFVLAAPPKPKVKIPAKYNDPEKSGLVQEVPAAGLTELKIDLK